MAKKGSGDFGDIDLDDLNLDFDFDNFDMGDDADAGKGGRDPITAFKKSFKSTARERLLDKTMLRRLVLSALPKGYTQAANAYDGLTAGIAKIYKDNQADLAPYARQMKTKLDRSNSILRNAMPKAFRDILEEAADGDKDRYAATDSGPSELQVNLAGLDNLFKLQVDNRLDQTVKDAYKDKVGRKRFEMEMAARVEMGQGISRIVAYQDNVLVQYHRKSLEIGYRQLDVATRAAFAATKYYGESLEILKATAKNTGLPDWVKLNSDEMIKQRISAKLADTLVGGVGKWSKKYFSNIGQNASDFLGGALDLKKNIDDIAELEGGKGSRAQAAGTMFGSMAGEFFGGMVENQLGEFAKKHKKKLEKVPGLKRFGNFLQNTLTGLPQKLNTYAQSETDNDNFILGMLEESLKAIIDQHHANTTISGQRYEDLDKPAIFDTLFYRSVTDIIPSYLASMDRWMSIMVTGEDQEEKAYSHYEGQLVGRSALNQRHFKRQVLQGSGGQKNNVDKVLSAIGTEGLSEEAIKALRQRLTVDMLKGLSFDPKRYIKPSYWSGASEDVAEELVDHIAESFGLDMQGKQTRKSDAISDRFTASNQHYTDVQNAMPGYADRMNLFSGVVGRRTWRELGLSKYSGGNDDFVDLEALASWLANEEGTVAPEVKQKLTAVEIKRRMEAARRQAEKKTEAGDADSFDPSKIRGFGGPSGPSNYNVVADVKWPELLNTSDAETHKRLDRMLEGMQAQLAVLEAIADGSMGGGGGGEGGPAPEGGPGRRPWFGRLSRGLFSGASWSLGKLAKGMGWYTRKTYGAIWGGVKGTAGLANSVRKGLFAPRGLGITDVYVAGNPEPVLLARDIKRGFYMDVNTKKTIEKIKDITGAVMNRDGEIVITEEEFKSGLMAGDGSSIVGFVAGKAFDAAGMLGKGMLWYTKSTYGLMGSAIKFGFDTLRDQFTQFDAYLPGDTEPRLRSTMFKKGFYRDENGEPIWSLKDVKGPVFDINGNEIISADELKQYGGAFYTRNGSLLYTVGRGVVSFSKFAMEQGWRAAKAYGRMVKSFYGKLWSGTKWAAGKIGGGIGKLFGYKKGGSGPGTGDSELDTATFEVSIEQLKVQTGILDFLRSRFSDHSTIFDKDGDGVKENSWADILQRRKAAAAGKSKTTGDNGDVVDAIDRLGEKLDKNFQSLEDVVEEAGEDSLLDQASQVDDLMGGRGDKGGRGKGKGGGRRPGRLGRFGRWMGKSRLGRGAMRVGGVLGRGAGALGRGALWAGRAGLGLLGMEGLAAGAGGMLMSGAATAATAAGGALATAGGWLASAATAAAGVLSAPVVLGAIAVAGVAYLGYRYYKSSQAKKYPLLYLRMTQYGAAPTNEDRVQKILQLEGLLYGQLRQTGDGTMSIDTDGIDIAKVFQIFGAIGDEERAHNLLLWISKRFRPVFLAHCAAMKKIKGSFQLESADDSINSSDLEGFLEGVNLPNMEAVYNDEDTSPFDGDLDTDADDVTSAFEMVREKAKKRDEEKKAPVEVSGMMAARGFASKTDPAKYDNKAVGVSQSGSNDPSEVRKGLLLSAIPTGGAAISHTSGAPTSTPSTSINIPTAVRYKTYGLMEFTLKKVEQLYKAEELVWPRITYDGTQSAGISGSADELEAQIRDLFKPANEAEEVQVNLWFRYRFLPTILQYAISVRRRYNGPAQMAWRNMTGPLMREVLTEVSETQAETPDGKQSVWAIRNSPWPGDAVETQAGTVSIYIDSLDTGDKGGPLTVQGLKDQDRASADNNRYQNRLTNIALGNTRGVNSGVSSRGGILGNYASIYGKGQVAGGVAGQSTTGDGSGNLLMRPGTSGEIVQHPGGGTDGDINSIPDAKGDGWDNVKDMIIAAAKMQGFDPKIAATVAGVESSYKLKASSGIAHGLYQFTMPTWNDMMRKYGAKFGIAPGTSPYDPRANAILGVRYLIDNYNTLKSKLSVPVTDSALYAAHFLGPSGATQLLSADPGTPVNQVVGAKAIANNKSILASSGAGTTVGEVIANLDRIVGRGRGMHDLGSSAGTVAAPTAQGTPTPPVPSMGDFSGTGSESTMTAEPTVKADTTTAPMPTPGLVTPPGDDLAAGAQRAAQAANAAGAAAPALASAAPAVASDAAPAAEDVAAQPAPTPTQAVVATQQAERQQVQQVSMQVTEDLLGQQLAYLGSIDSTLRDIREAMAGSLAKNQQRPEPGTPPVPPFLQPQSRQASTLQRAPLSTARKNPVT